MSLISPMRIGGIDDLASENEFYGVAETGDARQVLGTAISLPDVPVSADDAKSCVFLSDSDVYPAGPFESASIGNPVDRSDSGFLTLLGLNLHFNPHINDLIPTQGTDVASQRSQTRAFPRSTPMIGRAF